MMDHEEGENPFAEVELEGGTMGDNSDFAEDDSLLENNNNKANETGVQKPAGMCSCFSIAFYQPYSHHSNLHISFLHDQQFHTRQ